MPELYMEYAYIIRSQASSLTANLELAEDLMQEARIALYRRRNKFLSARYPAVAKRSLVRRIINCAMKDYLLYKHPIISMGRKARAKDAVVTAIIESELPPANRGHLPDISESIINLVYYDSLLSRLPGQESVIVSMVILGYSQSNIAESLHKSRDYVNYYCRKAFRRLLHVQ